MTRSYLLGAATVALLAATGAARAADVMPFVVAAGPVAVAVGPTVSIQVETGLYASAYGDGYLDLSYGFDGEINVVSASGWGFNLLGGAGFGFYRLPNQPFTFDYGSSFRAELYRVIGNAEVGFFVAPYGINPLNFDFGPTFRYQTDRVEFRHETEVSVYDTDWWVEMQNDLTVHLNQRLDIGGDAELEFGAFGVHLNVGTLTRMKFNDRLTIEAWTDTDWNFAGDFDFDLGVEATADVNDHLTLEGGVDVDLLGGFGFGVYGEAKLHIGPLSPYAGGYWYGAGWNGYAGVELEQQIGTGPFKLIGDAGANFYSGGVPNYYANIGIRFNHGDVDDLLYTGEDRGS